MSKLPAVLLSVILLTLAVAVTATDELFLDESTAISTLAPTSYTPNQGVLVTIAVTPASTVNAQAIEDAPPSGWSVSGISASGTWDAVNGKVKWGPFFDNGARDLSYTAAPPLGETGTKTFVGSASFDGASVSITGARSISPVVGTCTVSCTATVPITGTAGQSVAFASTVTPSNCTGTPTFDWNFGDGTAHGAAQNPSHTYGTAGSYNWALTVTVNGVTCTKSGSMTINPVAGSGTAVCTLAPTSYTPNQGVLVTIAVTPASTVNAQAIEDAPPSGWSVSGISASGTWDAVNGKVKWGPFFDNGARDLSYTATPPVGEAGTKTFSGSASFDGASITITGVRSISPVVGTCTVSCTATVPTMGTAGQSIAFASTVTPSNCSGSPTFDWNFGDGTAYGTVQNPSHTYGTAGSYSWTLTVTVNGVTCSKTGSMTINPVAGSGTAVCTLAPTSYTPNQGVLVTIAVTPASSVNAQAIEDAPPSGWSVSGISASGTWDAVNGKVKWGPFFDNGARNLSYTVTPPVGEAGTKTFSGSASFDGASITITGARSISPVVGTCTVSCTATVSTTGTAGQSVAFASTVTPSSCTGTPTFDWNFGDGTAHGAVQNPSHTYGTAGSYNWALTVTVNGVACTKAGTIVIGPRPPTISYLTKLGNPFRINVYGGNLQAGVKVYINGVQWYSMKYKSTGLIRLLGGGSLKSQVPRYTPRTFRFVNPDGGEVSYTWQW